MDGTVVYATMPTNPKRRRDMEALLLGVAGIIGTLFSPVVAGRAQRAVLRADRMDDRRLDAYVDLIEIAGHFQENTQNWSATPLADLPEPETGRLRHIDAQIRVVGSHDAREAMIQVSRLVTKFYSELWRARLRAKNAEIRGDADTPEAMAARMSLGEIADQVSRAVENLEARIRGEMSSRRPPR